MQCSNKKKTLIQYVGWKINGISCSSLFTVYILNAYAILNVISMVIVIQVFKDLLKLDHRNSIKKYLSNYS